MLHRIEGWRFRLTLDASFADVCSEVAKTALGEQEALC
jgi:hypothetical protein